MTCFVEMERQFAAIFDWDLLIMTMGGEFYVVGLFNFHNNVAIDLIDDSYLVT